MADYWKRKVLTQAEYDALKTDLPNDELINISDSMSANLALEGVQFTSVGGGGGAPTTASYLTAGNETALLPNSINMGAVGTSGNANLLVNTPSGGIASFSGIEGIAGTVCVTKPDGTISFETTIDTDNNAFEINAGTSTLITYGENTSIRSGTDLLNDTNLNVSKFGGVDINSYTQPIDLNSPTINLSNGISSPALTMSSVMGFNLDTASLSGEITSPDFTVLTGTGSSMGVSAGGAFLQSTTEVSTTSPINSFSNGAGTPTVLIDSTGVNATTLNSAEEISLTTTFNDASIRLNAGQNVYLNAANQVSTNSLTTQLNSTVSHTVVSPRVTLSNGVGTPKIDARAIGITLSTEGAGEDIGITASGSGSAISLSAISASHTLTMNNSGITVRSPVISIANTAGAAPSITLNNELLLEAAQDYNLDLTASGTGNINITSDSINTILSPNNILSNGLSTPTVETTTTGVNITTDQASETVSINCSGLGSSINLDSQSNTIDISAGGIISTAPLVTMTTGTCRVSAEPSGVVIDTQNTLEPIYIQTLGVGADIGITSGGNFTVSSTGTGGNTLTSTVANSLTAPINIISNGGSSPAVQVNDSASGVQILGRNRGVTMTGTSGNIAVSTSSTGTISISSNTTLAESAVTSIVSTSPINRLFNGAGTPTIEALTTGINLTTSGLPIALNSGTNGNISLTNAGTGTIALTSATSSIMQAPTTRMWNGGTTPSVLVNASGITASTSGLPIALNSGTNGNITLTSAGTGTNTITSAVSNTLTAPTNTISNGGTTPRMIVDANTAYFAADVGGFIPYIALRTSGDVIDLLSWNNPIAIRAGTSSITLSAFTINIPLIGTGTGTALVRDASNNMVLNTSSVRYKENIRPLEVDSSKIYDLTAKNFNYKSQPGLDIFGWIAEETNEIIPELVNLNSDGEPESIRYAETSVLIIEEMKKMRSALSSLVTLVENLTAEVNTLKGQ